MKDPAFQINLYYINKTLDWNKNQETWNGNLKAQKNHHLLTYYYYLNYDNCDFRVVRYPTTLAPS